MWHNTETHVAAHAFIINCTPLPVSMLLLNRNVRDWVLFPLTATVILMMVGRQYLTKLFASGSSAQPELDANVIREKQALARAQVLKAGATNLPESAFNARKAYFAAPETGLFCQKAKSPNPREAMASNPDFMMNMMKQSMGGMVPQIAMGTFVNYFFSGFILGKVPFPLTSRFRLMLQRGMDLPSLDPSYFTSLSYYLLLLFGLRGVFSLFFREDTIDDAAMMQRQQQAMQQSNPMGQDVQKLFESEKQAFDLYDWHDGLVHAEVGAARVLREVLR